MKDLIDNNTVKKSTASLGFIGAAVLSSLFLGGCGSKEAPAPPAPPAVTVASPELREVSVFKSYPATLQGTSEIEIRARVSGYLEETNFNEGTMVKKG